MRPQQRVVRVLRRGPAHVTVGGVDTLLGCGPRRARGDDPTTTSSPRPAHQAVLVAAGGCGSPPGQSRPRRCRRSWCHAQSNRPAPWSPTSRAHPPPPRQPPPGVGRPGGRSHSPLPPPTPAARAQRPCRAARRSRHRRCGTGLERSPPQRGPTLRSCSTPCAGPGRSPPRRP
jgi:hypothetical protein